MAVGLDESIDLALMEPVFEEYAGQEGALIPILERAQELYGSLSLPIYQLVARRLKLSVGQVYSTATFYALFARRPEEQHV
ncbi:MAG: NAD(P)H-dependent oxidoreductase subunit E, partial [Desulfobulbus sp.]